MNNNLNTSSNSINNNLDTLTLNIICLTANENSSKGIAEVVSNQKIDINGLYTNSLDGNYLVVYPRWPNCSKTLSNTAVSDAILVGCENLEEYSAIESYLLSKETMSLIVFWSNNEELKEQVSKFKNGKFMKKSDTSISDIRNFIVAEIVELNKTIRDIFNTLDTNKSGFLEKKEVLNYARDKGDNVSSQEFVDTLNIIDRHGLGKICFEDFEKWWKMGGHKNSLFGRLIQINDFSNRLLLNDEKYQQLKSELTKTKKENDKSSHLIKFHSNIPVVSPGFQIFMNILIGGDEKDQARNIYLQRFSEDHYKKLKKSQWFQIALNVDPSEAKKVANSLRILRESVLGLLEKSNRSAASFIRSFFEIDVVVIDNVVLLTFKLKIDLQDYFENALLPLLQFFDLFSSSKESTSQFLIDLQTELKLEDILTKNMSIKEAFQVYAFEIKANLIRGHLRKIARTFKFESELNSIFHFLTAPDSVDMNSRMEIDNLIDEKEQNIKLGFLGEICDYYLSQYESIVPFLKRINQFEFALNFNKLFIDSRIKFK